MFKIPGNRVGRVKVRKTMINIEFDFREFEEYAAKLKARVDQVPYALSRALNDAAFLTLARLKDTWTSSVQVKSPNFIGAALKVQPSDKVNLEVHIYDKIARDTGHGGHLFEHAYGGMKTAQKQNLAIPFKSWVKYTAHGVSKAQLPRAIIAATPKRALRITNTGILIGEGGRLHLRYTLKSSAAIHADVPFEATFEATMRAAIYDEFPHRLLQAMATAR